MAGDTTRPLSTEEAKARLRAALQNATPAAWVKHHPLTALTLAIASGFVTAQLKRPLASNLMLVQKLILPLLLSAVRRK